MYSDNTILPYGKYKFMRLCHLPSDYLLRVYSNPCQHDRELHAYIAAHLEKIRAEVGCKIPYKAFKKVCEKRAFSCERSARSALKTVHHHSKEQKKPVRCYKCIECEAWHLTSMPYGNWKRTQSGFRNARV